MPRRELRSGGVQGPGTERSVNAETRLRARPNASYGDVLHHYCITGNVFRVIETLDRGSRRFAKFVRLRPGLREPAWVNARTGKRVFAAPPTGRTI